MRRKVNFLFRTFLRTINSCRVWKKQPITCVQKIIIYHRASNTKFQKSKRTFFTSTLTMKNCREFNISLQKQNRSRNGFFYCDALSVEQINNIAISTFQTKGALFVNGRIFKCRWFIFSAFYINKKSSEIFLFRSPKSSDAIKPGNSKNQCCQIFLGITYQNMENIPNDHILCQIAIKYTKGP
jgi:hypothetical protein